MKLSIITLFPKMISGFVEESIIKKAQEKKLVEIEFVNLRDFAIDKYGSVDDKPYGGGVGMLLRVDPIYKAIKKITNGELRIKNSNPQSVIRNRIILTSPRGKSFTQKKAREYAKLDHLVIVAGHYEGFDERVLDYVDEEVSLGDFVMTGGEITAAAIADATVRLIPGVLKNNEATEIESFFEIPLKRLSELLGPHKIVDDLIKKNKKTVKLLEFPQYTRPEEYKGKKVPEVLASGDHKKIEDWRLKAAFEETLKKRKDLLS